MKKLVVVLLLFFSTSLLSQSKFSVILSSGLLMPNSSTFKLGIGGHISFNYDINDNFAIALTSGYSAWGYNNTRNYNTKIIPIILGTKYYFMNNNAIIPYLIGELQVIAGELNYSYDNYIKTDTGLKFTNTVNGTKSFLDYGVGIGAGLKFPLNNSFGIDLSSSMLLFAEHSDFLNIRTMLGFSYGF